MTLQFMLTIFIMVCLVITFGLSLYLIYDLRQFSQYRREVEKDILEAIRLLPEAQEDRSREG